MTQQLSMASREVVGDHEEITRAVLNAASRGAVVSVHDAYDLEDGRVSVRLSMGPQATLSPAAGSGGPRWTLWHTGVVGASLALGVLIWAVVFLVILAVAWVKANVALTALIAIGLALPVILVSTVLTGRTSGGGFQ